MEYPNFYETLKEASMRLRRTVVLYDGEPYEVMAITNHKPDGIFRVYLWPIGRHPEPERPQPQNYSPESASVGPYLDEWMLGAGKNSGLLRKMMNSPMFNKFRPYPLGMCNLKGEGAFYLERQPNRKSEQGLIGTMLYETPVSTAVSRNNTMKRVGLTVSIYGEAFRQCVLGKYPSAAECLTNLTDPEVVNDAAAFSRSFAFVRGPLEMLFLFYKTDVVGLLPNGDFSLLKLGREFGFVREAIEELNLFQIIK